MSLRFPSIAFCSSTANTLYARVIIDRVAGFAILGEGPFRNNPVVGLKLVFDMNPHVTVDTIGGTTLDLQTLGPALRTIDCTPALGVHAVWSYSVALANPELPDLNSRYNLYDFANGEWNWIDPDWMQSGVNAFAVRSGGASVAADPVSGCAVITGAGLVPFPPVGSAEPAAQRGRLLAATGLDALRAAGCVILDPLGRRVATPTPAGVYFILRDGRPLGKAAIAR